MPHLQSNWITKAGDTSNPVLKEFHHITSAAISLSHRHLTLSYIKRGCILRHILSKSCEGKPFSSLLHLGNNGLESLGVIYGQVGEHLTVDLDTGLVQQTHELRVAQTFQTSGCVDTLNPQCTESALLVAAVTECIGKTLFPSVLGNGPNILAGTKVTSGQAQDFLSLSS